jgi:hypothetical protein
MYSFFYSVSGETADPGKTKKYYFEEEAIDSYREDNDLISCGIHHIIDKEPVHYFLLFRDIINNVSFNKAGSINTMSNIPFEFYIGEKLFLSETLNSDSFNYMQGNLQKLLIKCKYKIQPYIFPNLQPRKMYTTNLFPMAFIGLLTQALAIYFFQNNYEYVMHAITSLQRNGNAPLCIGAVKNKEEAGIHFPDLKAADLFQ